MPRGPAPKPTALKRLAGNPGKHRLNDREPQPRGKEPTCPKHLDKEARAEWKRISRELIALGLLTSVDRSCLAGYCQTWSRWCHAEQQLVKTGLVVKSPKSGFPINSPYLGIANVAMDHMRRFAQEFGLTPASRSRVSADAPPTAADPFEEFMSSIGAGEIDVTTCADTEPQTIRTQGK